MTATPFAAVLFDCDGVLVDSEPAGFDLLIEDFAAHGFEGDRHALEKTFVGNTIPGIWKAARDSGILLPEDWVSEFYERLYERLAAGTDLMPGVPGVFDRLDAAGIPYAVGSNGSSRKMQITLGQHPQILSRLEGRLFSGQEISRPKPAPDLYLLAAKALGADPARCAVIEDSPTGARAAKAAGMACFGYAPQGDHPDLAAEGATLFRDMEALPGLLGL